MGLEDGILMSFEEFVTRYDIPNKHQFKYLQVRNYIRSSQNQSLSIPLLSSLEMEMKNLKDQWFCLIIDRILII